MTRVLIAECKQEVSTFNPVPSHYEDFRVVRGKAMLDYHRTVSEEVAGALSVFDQDTSVECVPAFGASSITSGGVLAAADSSRISTSRGALTPRARTALTISRGPAQQEIHH